MTTEKANIFKLDSATLQEYKSNPFFDCMPGAEEFAECLKCQVLTKASPYVLLLENNFGMGKTHFATRFAYYLRECKIDTVYFSAWENDYIEQPFVSFSAEILKYFEKSKTVRNENLTKAAKSIYELTLNLLKSTSVTAGINILGYENSITVDNKDVIEAVEQFFNNFIKKDDFLISFKNTLKSFIAELPNHKLVIIVDELDRCRPDYAMKTLEIIKHFFDIEGLFFIVPTNMRSLQRSVKALYGIDDEKSDDTIYENYINKFFNDKFCMYEPDYLSLVKNLISKDSVNFLIKKNKLVLCDQYNSLEVLQKSIAKFSRDYKLSIREVKKICERAVYICIHSNKNINCEYIAYRLCEHESRDVNNNSSVDLTNPLSKDSKSKKAELLKFQVPQDVYKIDNTIYHQDFSNEYEIFRDRRFNSYKEFDDFYTYFNSQPPAFASFRKINDQFMRISHSYNFPLLKNYIEQKKSDIDNYRKEWDSSDDDDSIRTYYNNVIENESYIHTGAFKINKKL